MDFPPPRCTVQFEHVAARRGLIDPVSPSHGQIQSEVQAPVSEQRRRVGADAPVPGTAALFRRSRGSGGGAGGLSVHRLQHWTCEPHTCSRSDQGQGKRVLQREQHTGSRTRVLWSLFSPQAVAANKQPQPKDVTLS